MRNPIHLSIILLGIAIGLGAAGPCPAAEPAGTPIVAASRIERVTVYPDRAAIERVARRIALPKGVSRILFRDLPLSLSAESVRAEGSGDQHTTITNVDTKRDFLAKVDQPRLDSLNAEFVRLQIVSAKLSAQREAHHLAAAFLKSVKSGERGADDAESDEPRARSPEELKEIFDLLRTEYGENQVQLVDLETAADAVNDTLGALQSQISAESSRLPRSRWTVAVEIWADAAGTMDLTLSYVVSGANWSPAYDARVSEDLSGVALVYSGIVSQTTGEAWEDVRLALSTAEPALGAQVPELAARWLSLPDPMPASRMDPNAPAGAMDEAVSQSKSEVKYQFRHRSANAVADALSRDAGLEGGGAAAPPSFAAEQLAMAPSSSGVTARFDVPTPQSLESGGGARRMTVGTIPLTGEISYQAVPAIAQHAYLVAKVKNASDLPILAGPSQVFLGSQFLGAGRIEEAPPGQEFDLSLGVDKSVSVERKLVRREKRTRDRGGDEQVEFLYRTVIENRKAIPVRIRVRDQVPVSQDRALVVADERLEPAPGERSKDEGLLTWDFAIPAAGKQTVEVGYEIRYPSGRQPIGLAMR